MELTKKELEMIGEVLESKLAQLQERINNYNEYAKEQEAENNGGDMMRAKARILEEKHSKLLMLALKVEKMSFEAD